ncbi:L-rhamnose-binding lectin CSL2-like [Gadus morhua]|uniref:L-rhamnose-binding lectin CSL2-like n=1 Tax=Gadus morhua TaxID=8049 RepID=UPI0011B473C2|nr:L-rhamnose-binding lectin CSL2-like [Gadus morhua]
MDPDFRGSPPLLEPLRDFRALRDSHYEGVISVLKVAKGWTNKKTCKEGEPSGQWANTAGALEALANRCNGKKVCEVDKEIFSDPCPDTYKYTQTTYTCLPAHHVVACELSTAELICGRIHHRCVTMCSTIKSHISSSPASSHVRFSSCLLPTQTAARR